MSTAPVKLSKPFANGPPTTQTLLLDKLNIRTSTPDSEALASSDDEADLHRPADQPQSATPHAKPARRPSWLNDPTPINLAHPRKGSLVTITKSPSTTLPNTPSAEPAPGSAFWGSNPAPSITRQPLSITSATFPWGPGIWGSDRKEPPSRFSEVLQSPTSVVVPSLPLSNSNALSFFNPADSSPNQSTTMQRDTATSGPGPIPFPIPLHPTIKTYRSQSYSVGQLEPDSPASSVMSSSLMLGRLRSHGHGVLQHRPSRPSMLSEMSSDGGLLGKLREVDDDDDDSITESMLGSQFLTTEARTIDLLSRENAMLRQQQFQTNRIRPRSSTQASFGLGTSFGLRQSVPEESEYAVDEVDEPSDGGSFARRALQRRLSELASTPSFRPSPLIENRPIESLRKATWQTSSDATTIGADLPQSRRHSFADVPLRQGSISSLADSVAALDLGIHMDVHGQQDLSAGFTDKPNFPPGHPASYFNVGPSHFASQSTSFINQLFSAHAIPAPFPNRPASPHRNNYAMGPPRPNQLLQVVLFKCARADVFYIQEGVGLTVKVGDLVVVEADRGTDLGTVARANVDWQTAKELKEHYAEEHYKWLMMYSQNASAPHEIGGSTLRSTPDVAVAGLNSHLQQPQPQPQQPQHQQQQHQQQQQHAQDPNAGELKPKLIRRVAQPHEVHSLRDKEANEAKAKRICMQKVKEHCLNMEILDAEYQMDWKKLTFYYFAESYVNFNSLVTDLFKVYKTRIWMSAINPASFASPTLGIQAPSGVGIGAVSLGRSSALIDRRPNQPHQQQPHQQQPHQQQPHQQQPHQQQPHQQQLHHQQPHQQHPRPQQSHQQHSHQQQSHQQQTHQQQPHQQLSHQQEQAQASYSPSSQLIRGFQPPLFRQAYVIDRPNGQGISFAASGLPPTQFEVLNLGRSSSLPYGPNISLPSDGVSGGAELPAQARGRFQTPQNLIRLPIHGSPSDFSPSADWAGAYQGLPMNIR